MIYCWCYLIEVAGEISHFADLKINDDNNYSSMNVVRQIWRCSPCWRCASVPLGKKRKFKGKVWGKRLDMVKILNILMLHIKWYIINWWSLNKNPDKLCLMVWKSWLWRTLCQMWRDGPTGCSLNSEFFRRFQSIPDSCLSLFSHGC